MKRLTRVFVHTDRTQPFTGSAIGSGLSALPNLTNRNYVIKFL